MTGAIPRGLPYGPVDPMACGRYKKDTKVKVVGTGWWCADDPNWIDKTMGAINGAGDEKWPQRLEAADATGSNEGWARGLGLSHPQTVLTALGQKNEKETWAPSEMGSGSQGWSSMRHACRSRLANVSDWP